MCRADSESFTLISGLLIGGAFLGALLFCWVLSVFFEWPVTLSWAHSEPQKFLVICLITPIVEEYLFRGIIFEFLENRLPSRPLFLFGWLSAANIASTILFVGLHLFTRDPLSAGLVIVPSLYLGMIKESSGKLWVCIGIHAFRNFCWGSIA